MDIYMVILRLIHILSGVFWAGATFILASHITPTVKATGTAGQEFMKYLSGKAKLSDILGLTGLLSLLSGLIMYSLQGWDRQLSSPSWIALTLGAIIGAAAYFHGLFVQRKAITGLQTVATQIEASGGPPSPDLVAQMGAMAAKIEKNGQLLAYLLGAAVVLMGVFQYL